MSIGSASALNDVTRSDLVEEAEGWAASTEVKTAAIDKTLEAISSANVAHEGLAQQIDTAFDTL